MRELIIEHFGTILGFGLLLLSFILESASKQLKPWSLLMLWIRRQLVGPLEDEIAKIQARNDAQDAEEAKYRAKQARRRIIIAADEIINGVSHSSEWFKDVLYDISDYSRYCFDNPKFQNHEAVLSINIVETAWNAHKTIKKGDAGNE